MEKREGRDKHKRPAAQYEDIDPSPLPPIAPDGGFMSTPIAQAPSVPAATPDVFVCLRGPCRHYWELQTFMGSGNPKDTWGDGGLREVESVDEDGEVTYGEGEVQMPRQSSRSCLAHPGTETELTDDAVYHCSRWDPMTPREVRRIERRREKHFKLHPEHRPIEDCLDDYELDDEEHDDDGTI